MQIDNMQIECFHKKMLLNLFFEDVLRFESLSLFFILVSSIHQLHY
jgi:hypothetical protein